MSVETQVQKVTINGNDSATVHSFSPLIIYKASDLVVVLRTAAGVETTLAQGETSTTYSVGIVTFPSTGSITYPASGGTPLATGDTLTIKRVTALEQQTKLGSQGAYDPNIQEQQFDKLVFIDQQQQEDIDRAIKVPVSYTGGASLALPEPEASTFLGWNADADAIINATVVASATVSVFMATVLDDLDAAAAQTTLGVLVGTDVQAFGEVLDDLNTLGAAASDGQFVVATDAGVFAYESGATVRTSLGLGTGDSPTFSGVSAGSINGHALGDINILDNPAHEVDQRSTDTRTGLGAVDIVLSDRWMLDATGSASARWTASVETASGPQTKAKWLKLVNTTADGSPGAAESHAVKQIVEAANCQPIVASDGSILAHIVSFQIIAHADGASSITFPADVGVSVRTVDGTARQYVTDVAVAADATFERVSIVVPADATGPINNDNGPGFEVALNLYAGSGQQGTAATWENDDDAKGTSSSDNWADATGNYIGFTHAKVEPGSTLSDFKHRGITEEINRCEWHYERFGPDASANKQYGNGQAISTTTARIVFDYSKKRDTPVAGHHGTVGDFQLSKADGTAEAVTMFTITVETLTSCLLNLSVAANLVAGNSTFLGDDSGKNTWIDVSAEFT